MALPAYPPLLPLGLQSGRAYQLRSPMTRSALENGQAIYRRKFTSVPQGATIQWLFTSVQVQVFEAWFLEQLNDGESYFTCTLKTPLGLGEHVCHFTNVYTGPSLVGPDLWEIRAELELRKRAVVDPGWSEFPEFLLFSDIIDKAVNREWPKA